MCTARGQLQAWANKIWYADSHPLVLVLLPFSLFYRWLVQVRQLLYRFGVLPIYVLPVPVIVVGNLTVGGTGKTPMVIWLVRYLKLRGYRVGVVSRGYRSKPSVRSKVQYVHADSDPRQVGDEPVLIARRGRCPVAIAKKRHLAAKALINKMQCDIIIADDGLQHYSLHRDIQICLVDGQRYFGNRHCLPAGPLREPPARLQTMDIVIDNGGTRCLGYRMEYEFGDLVNLHDPEKRMPLSALHGQTVRALAGLGNPDRFFSLLHAHDLRLIKHVFPDHHDYTHTDIHFGDDRLVIMTEKDAVKCGHIFSENHWFLPIQASLSDPFIDRFSSLLQGVVDEQKIA